MRTTNTILLPAILLAACTRPSDPAATPDPAPAAAFALPADSEAAEQAITAELLRSHVAVLAADDTAGRGAGSPGDERTRAYLVSVLAGMGLEPAGEAGGWEQSFELVNTTSHPPDTWTFTGAGAEVALRSFDDYIAGSGVQSETTELRDAEVVFVGFGISAPEYQWDDFKGADLRGKVLLMMNNDPDWDEALFAGNRRLYYGRWDYKYASAARAGAVAAILIHPTPSAGYPFSVVQTSWSGEQPDLPSAGEPRVLVEAWATEEASRRLVAAGGFDLDELRARARERDFAPVPLSLETSLVLRNTLRRTRSANVLGRLQGSDPELRREVVLYSAHHDHLGDGGKPPDPIFNGAVDNASGVAQVLAIARAMTTLSERPRRSVVFNFVGGEESGLLGSKYWASHPTVHPGLVAANINFDAGNIWGKTSDVAFIGYGKSDLDAVVEEMARRQQRTVVGDQFPDRGFYYRSDQFSFARVGIPAIYLDVGAEFVGRPAGWGRETIETWEAQHYHQPSDQLDESWSFDGLIDDARLGLACGLVIANRDQLPAWNEGDEFAAARQQALAERPGE